MIYPNRIPTAPKISPALKLLCGSCDMPIPFLAGEGRCFEGRNEKAHFKKHRGMGSDIFGKIDGDNIGKDLRSAGACSNLQRPFTKRNSKVNGGSEFGA